MNLKNEALKFHKRYKPIPKPFYVVRLDDHCMVCTLDDDYNLVEEISVIHWNKWIVRRWSFSFAKACYDRRTR